MIRFSILFLVLYNSLCLTAQSLTLTGSSGDVLSINQDINISYSIGEPIVHRADLYEYIITAGFQQHFISDLDFVKQDEDSISKELAVSIAPNPFDDQFIITLEKAHTFIEASLFLIDATGKVIADAILPSFTHSHIINLPQLPSGPYFLLIMGESGKVLIQKTVIKQ